MLKKSDQAPIAEILRSEVNLLNLPFFGLWDKDLRRRTITEFKGVEERDGSRIQIQWTVTGDARLGYPGPLDRKVFRAIEHMITSQVPPLENPVRLGSFGDIARLLEFKKRKKGGYPDWVYSRIRQSIQRIAAARVFSKGTWTARTKDDDGKVTRRYVEDGPFAIYARPFFAWDKLPDGTIADTNYLELGSWYLDSINARYIRPLDFNYYKSFKTNIGPRLYELLGTKFYAWRPGQAPRRFRYSTLCQLLPATKQRYLAKAKQMLEPGHEELKKTGFLAGYRWEPIDGEKSDWMLYYWPGRRALDEITGKAFKSAPKPMPQLSPADLEPATLELFTQATLPAELNPRLANLWDDVLTRLRDTLPFPTFSTYLADTVLLDLQEGKATVAISSQNTMRPLNRIHGHIVRALAKALDRPLDEVDIDFVVSQPTEIEDYPA